MDKSIAFLEVVHKNISRFARADNVTVHQRVHKNVYTLYIRMDNDIAIQLTHKGQCVSSKKIFSA